MGTPENHLDEAVLTNTHNLYFAAKIREIVILLTPVLYIKVGYKGVFISRRCFPDGNVLVYYGYFTVVGSQTIIFM